MIITGIDGDLVNWNFAGAAMQDKTEGEMAILLDQLVEEILVNTKCTHYWGFIGSGPSFRRKISQQIGWDEHRNRFQFVQTYKGKRDGKQKHKWFYFLRERLVDKWQFQRVVDIEVDDALRICSRRYTTENDSVILATTDKDSYQNPVLHYHFKTELFTIVTDEMAQFQYYKQLLMGDATDCITGIPGLGEVKATRILQQTDPELYEATVRSLYLESYGVNGEDVFRITKRLVKLLDYWPLFKIPEPLVFERNPANNRALTW